jgi:hypothetical protein
VTITEPSGEFAIAPDLIEQPAITHRVLHRGEYPIASECSSLGSLTFQIANKLRSMPVVQ